MLTVSLRTPSSKITRKIVLKSPSNGTPNTLSAFACNHVGRFSKLYVTISPSGSNDSAIYKNSSSSVADVTIGEVNTGGSFTDKTSMNTVSVTDSPYISVAVIESSACPCASWINEHSIRVSNKVGINKELSELFTEYCKLSPSGIFGS